MAHPHLLAPGDSAEKESSRRAVRSSCANPYSPLSPFSHRAAQEVRHQLLPVANAQHRNSGIEQRRIDGRAAGIVNAGRTAGDDDPFASCQLGGGRFAGSHFRVNAEFADLTGDEMTVLSSGVEDGDLGGQLLS